MFSINSGDISNVSSSLELKEKLTILNDIEASYSKEVITDAEFNRFKTQILNKKNYTFTIPLGYIMEL
jgi:hypothetical protein